MSTLLLLIGLPGSGKSTLAACLNQAYSYPIVSTDSIRHQLFGDESIQGDWSKIEAEVQRQLRSSLIQIQQGQTQAVIYDATNTRRRNRRRAMLLFRSIGFTSVKAIWLNLPLSICLMRNQHRSRQVPEAVILQMHRQLTGAPPSLAEGFDRLVCLEGW